MSKKLTLKSSDGEVFVVEESVATKSVTINNMVEDVCIDTGNAVPVPNVDGGPPNVDGETLALVLEYCKRHASGAGEVELEAFDKEFLQKDQAVLYKLIMAANFLNVQDLLLALCGKVASMIRGKNPQEIRNIFHIENDFSPEEEEQARAENAWAFQ